jgi:hypothetical protein
MTTALPSKFFPPNEIHGWCEVRDINVSGSYRLTTAGALTLFTDNNGTFPANFINTGWRGFNIHF